MVPILFISHSKILGCDMKVLPRVPIEEVAQLRATIVDLETSA
jgi:hypothetical protein